jgi:hypothetical protein
MGAQKQCEFVIQLFVRVAFTVEYLNYTFLTQQLTREPPPSLLTRCARQQRGLKSKAKKSRVRLRAGGFFIVVIDKNDGVYTQGPQGAFAIG